MIHSQLGRLVLGGRESSPDEHSASPDEDGGYGELMDAIDRLLEQIESEPDRPAG
jgi:hypothetical protein